MFLLNKWRTFASSLFEITKAFIMKKVGITILVVGLIITLITGFSFITREKVVDIGNVEITRNKKHAVVWPPLAGVAVMIIGGGIILIGTKKG